MTTVLIKQPSFFLLLHNIVSFYFICQLSWEANFYLKENLWKGSRQISRFLQSWNT